MINFPPNCKHFPPKLQFPRNEILKFYTFSMHAHQNYVTMILKKYKFKCISNSTVFMYAASVKVVTRHTKIWSIQNNQIM